MGFLLPSNLNQGILKRFTEANFQEPLSPLPPPNPHSQSRVFPPRGRRRILSTLLTLTSAYSQGESFMLGKASHKNQRLHPDPEPRLQSRRVNPQEANHCPHPQLQRYDSNCPSLHHEPSWLPFSGTFGVIFFYLHLMLFIITNSTQHI